MAGAGISWSDNALELRVEVDGDGIARLGYLNDPSAAPQGAGEHRAAQPGAHRSSLDGVTQSSQPGAHQSSLDGAPPAAAGPGLPLLDVVLGGSGRHFSGRRYSESVVGGRMGYAGHTEQAEGRYRELRFELQDPPTGLRATVTYQVLVGGGVLRSRTRLTNAGSAPVTVESVTSFLGGGLPGAGGSLEEVDVWWAENDWLSESRWQRRALRQALPDLNRPLHGSRSRASYSVTGQGTWSAGGYLPMGAVVNRATGYTMLWQVEHNGAWQWQVGEQTGEGPGASYVALLGPTDIDHHWRLTLAPGESFETVPVALAVSAHGFEEAVARMTRYRRVLRRPHEDHRRLPVIFNDYMNTLMGEPTTERLLPLIDAAAEVGAEYFCIDSGWYAEVGQGWWDTVGSWAPSKTRFPNGIGEVLDHIKAKGMVPGLWVEPEVVGVNSPVADELPVGAFFVRDGARVVEAGRYQLDLCHPMARAHLDKTIDFLVGDLGVGYLKMDYNINVAPGTDAGGLAPGMGMLAHNRALLEWVDAVLDRHPGLTIENCSSGGMRADYALLSRLQLQSTSDQQDLLRYPPIAAAAPVGVAPEQAAVWAYPQPDWDDDMIAFTLCSAMLGRVHLSGHIDAMSPAQKALVGQAVQVYKQLRPHLAEAVPFWPLGLPGWEDPWVALGMHAPGATFLVIWRRPVGDGAGAGEAGPCEMSVPVSPEMVAGQEPQVLFPRTPVALGWDSAKGELCVPLPRTPSACLVAFGGGITV